MEAEDLSAVKSGPLILQDVGAYQFQAQPDYAQVYNLPRREAGTYFRRDDVVYLAD
jgi:hypothetical protein